MLLSCQIVYFAIIFVARESVQNLSWAAVLWPKYADLYFAVVLGQQVEIKTGDCFTVQT